MQIHIYIEYIFSLSFIYSLMKEAFFLVGWILSSLPKDKPTQNVLTIALFGKKVFAIN